MVYSISAAVYTSIFGIFHERVVGRGVLDFCVDVQLVCPRLIGENRYTALVRQPGVRLVFIARRPCFPWPNHPPWLLPGIYCVSFEGLGGFHGF